MKLGHREGFRQAGPAMLLKELLDPRAKLPVLLAQQSNFSWCLSARNLGGEHDAGKGDTAPPAPRDALSSDGLPRFFPSRGNHPVVA